MKFPFLSSKNNKEIKMVEIDKISPNPYQPRFDFEKEDIEEFENKVEAIYEDIYTRELENRRLEELRDTLLPKLMSGEIRVDDIKLDELKLNNEV